ncbi:MAG TPA: hypothetical protein VHC45_14300 [Gaiellaceae bacterium]|jgi:hypothetical protein|nr:hypothetical protein [Gaiellaceae bacterium]
MSQTLDPVGRAVAIASAGHGGRSPDRHGRVIDVLVDLDGEPAFLVVEWSDGSVSVVPVAACEIDA